MDKFEKLVCRLENAVQRLEEISVEQPTPSHRWKPGQSGNPSYTPAYMSEQQKMEFLVNKEYLTDIYNARKSLYEKGVLSEGIPPFPTSHTNRITNEAKIRVLELFSNQSKEDIKKSMIAYSDAILLNGMPQKNIIDDFATKENGRFIVFEKHLAFFKQRYVTDESTGLIADKEAIENKWYKRIFSI